MSYEANFNTALTYIRSGLPEMAVEALYKALAGVSVNEKTPENIVYLRILTQLARLSLERGRRDEAFKYISEGLKLRKDHTDFLFLNALYLLDENKYDQVTGTLITYLVSLLQADAAKYDYEFTSAGALKEVYGRLIPASYSKSVTHVDILNIVRQLSEKTGSELISQAYRIMLEIDKGRKVDDA